MATIKQVAKLAGVSVATVSRVLNDSGYVQADTRKKVEEAIKQLDFIPNEVARSLFKKESRLVGLLLPDITNPFFPELARGIEDELQKEGYYLLFGNSDEKLEKELNYIQTFVKNNVVGLISATNLADKSNYEHLSLPIVFLDRGPECEYSVFSDGKEGGRIAARELIKRGSEKITVLKGPSHVLPAQERFQGTIEVLGQSNVDFQVISTTSFSFLEAKAWAKEIFEKYPDTDGIIASNDITASAILHEALQQGKAIPDELQIIGYDDIQQSSLLFPSLSTIRQPIYEMGKEAARVLISLIKGEMIEQSQIKLAVSFVDRNTTRKAKE
ncbi:LacI family transcriptional regulator [Neobacillus notoginsengisoli]|uniref:LacI family transcriptional regulator n=1 Tax=Neobacillus notoginsengisoli TaxID=1578198 RepID=A0A417Z0G8_9BACI|nr:LacI family DNA-binding transcriptional regulator [Neobacillus notoginsengisoli]RHW43565.1 LacI family transcriptional regulator [Neobacillus notoginsengisoli]